MAARTRFAPSPTGSMHIGNVRTAVFAWLFARHHGGQFVLRIEDTDRSRMVEGAVDEILDGLKWLGLQWDEGPIFQSERLDIYHKLAGDLLESGEAYRCWCSSERLAEMREAQKAAGHATGYDRRCRQDARGHSPDEPHVIRFAMPLEGETCFHDEVRGDITFDNALIDDFVMLKADGFPTYQFANVVDDHLMGITHVIRADEWVSSTPKHVQLYQSFGWEPPKFAHPSLILGPDRSKLGKRHGATSFGDFVKRGYLPDALVNFLSLLGWSPGDDREVMSRAELIEAFDIGGMVRNPAIFDAQKLDWISRQHIRMLADRDLADLALPVLEERGLASPQPEATYLAAVCGLMKERLTVVPDIADLAAYFFEEDFGFDDKARKWLEEPGARELFAALADALETTGWEEQSIEEVVRLTGQRLGREGGQIIHPLRAAVTGTTVGPGLFALLAILGNDRVVARLRRAASYSEELHANH